MAVSAHEKLGTLSMAKVSTMKQKAVKVRFVFEIKNDVSGEKTCYKARLVAPGLYAVLGRAFEELWVLVPNAWTSRARFSVEAANERNVHHFDFNTGFPNAKMNKEMYIKLPDVVETGEPAEVRRLSLALYESKQARRLWGMKLSEEIEQMGAARSTVDPCLFECNHPVHGRVFILVYVEDLIVAGKSFAGVAAIKSGVSDKFYERNMGEFKDFICMKVMRDKAAKKLRLSTPGHIMGLLQAFEMHMCTPNETAMMSRAKLSKTRENHFLYGCRYAELMGSLLYLSTTTRPDTAFAVGVLSRFVSCPDRE